MNEFDWIQLSIHSYLCHNRHELFRLTSNDVNDAKSTRFCCLIEEEYYKKEELEEEEKKEDKGKQDKNKSEEASAINLDLGLNGSNASVFGFQWNH